MGLYGAWNLLSGKRQISWGDASLGSEVGKYAYVSCPALLPLFAGIAEPEHAERMIRKYVLSPEHFRSRFGIRSLSGSSEYYNNARWGNPPRFGDWSRLTNSNWQGPVWIPLNWFVFHGLLRYGFFGEAQAVGRAMLAVHDSGTMRDVMDDYGRQAPGANNPEKSGTFYIDGFGAFAGLLRGLFEVEYLASGIALLPHLPETVTSYVQRVPFFWGGKRILPHVMGSGNTVRGVRVNGEPRGVECREGRFVFGWEALPETAEIEFLRE